MPSTVDKGRLDLDRFRQSGLLVRAGEAIARGDGYFRGVLDALPAAVYITDADGRITYYNEAAAALWGHRPKLGENQWCGSWKLYWPDGRVLPHDQCPMAIALRERRPIRGMEAVAERPDGVCVPFIPYPTPLYDSTGELIGAVNLLVDISGRKHAEEYAQRLASIVESSDDAIVSKDLNGIITSWNRGAERLFGYTADEVIGKPVMILIPPDRQNEEPEILARIRRGERIDHYETIRRRKDGSLVDISLTISPLRNADGKIVGASKIARDITERRRSGDRQQLLLREMDHRIKNLFSLAGSVVSLSARSARTPKELAAAVGDRLAALARAHSLTLVKPSGATDTAEHPATLHALVRTITSPYEGRNSQDKERVTVSGSDIPLSPRSVTSLALLVHEFVTNAAKYGALSTPNGHVDVHCHEDNGELVLTWRERGGPPVNHRTDGEGFGSVLTRTAVKGQLNGAISRDWAPEGLTIRLSMARECLMS
jgi:PAS domain S-box-containing protein